MKFPQFLARSRLRSFLLKHKIAFKHVQLATNMALLWLIRWLRRGVHFTRRYPYALLSVLLLGMIGLAIPSDTTQEKIRIDHGPSNALSLTLYTYSDNAIDIWPLILQSYNNSYSDDEYSWELDINGAIIDSGIDPSVLHADQSYMWFNGGNDSDTNFLVNDFYGYDFLNWDPSMPDSSEHSTRSADIIKTPFDYSSLLLVLDLSGSMSKMHEGVPAHTNGDIISGTSRVSMMKALLKARNLDVASYVPSSGDKEFAGHDQQIAPTVCIVEAYKHGLSFYYDMSTYYGDGMLSLDVETSTSMQGIHLHFIAPEYSVHEDQETNNLAAIPVTIAAYGSGSAILFPPNNAMGVTPLSPNEASVSGALISPVLLSNTAGSKAIVNWLWILSITLVFLLVVLILLLWQYIRSRDAVFHPPKRQADSPLVIKDVMRLIARAELEQALTLLENTLEARNEDLLHEIILLQFQLHEIEREYRKHVITYEENYCMKNRIASSTLALLTQLRSQPQLLGG